MIAPPDPIRVLVADDSTATRGLLARIINAEQDMCVVASVAHGRSAIEMLRHRSADVVLLDVEMPVMDGLTALPLILAEWPGLRVIMASSLTQRGAEVTLRALALGAADYVPKPTSLSPARGAAAMAGELVAKIRALGEASRASAAPHSPGRPLLERGGALLDGTARVVAVAASTGGPNALSHLLRGLSRDFPLPILIVQHMPPLFTAALAERLGRETGRPCREARDGEPLRAGHTYVAPGDHHLTVELEEARPILRVDQGAPVNYCRPSADPLLASVAEVFGAAALAVVLTGMGEDGRRGAEAVVARGGRVVVQDKASSVVWGMPGAVYHAGLASAVLPVQGIAEQIQLLVAPPATAR